MAVNFLITLLLTLGIVVLALLVFRYFAAPVYSVEAINVKRFFETLLNGQATIADWDVFTGMPIRQDRELDEIRCECAMLAPLELSERDGLMVLSETGHRQITYLLDRIDKKIQASESENAR